MPKEDTPDRYVELNAIHALLRFAAARADEIEAGPLAHAIDHAQKIAHAEIVHYTAPDLSEDDLTVQPLKLRSKS